MYFTCSFQGNATWYYKNGPLPLNALTKTSNDATKKILILYDVSVLTSGTYQCHGNNNEKCTQFRAEGILAITGAFLLKVLILLLILIAFIFCILKIDYNMHHTISSLLKFREYNNF